MYSCIISCENNTKHSSLDIALKLAGLDLGEPKHIGKIVYSPGNRDDFVRPGDEYELFYRDSTWISLGRIMSNTDSLTYTSVPSNRLLYLKNHTGGVQERIFTYENGKQVWW